MRRLAMLGLLGFSCLNCRAAKALCMPGLSKPAQPLHSILEISLRCMVRAAANVHPDLNVSSLDEWASLLRDPHVVHHNQFPSRSQEAVQAAEVQAARPSLAGDLERRESPDGCPCIVTDRSAHFWLIRARHPAHLRRPCISEAKGWLKALLGAPRSKVAPMLPMPSRSTGRWGGWFRKPQCPAPPILVTWHSPPPRWIRWPIVRDHRPGEPRLDRPPMPSRKPTSSGITLPIVKHFLGWCAIQPQIGRALLLRRF